LNKEPQAISTYGKQDKPLLKTKMKNIKTQTNMKDLTVQSILDTKSAQYITDNAIAILALIDIEEAQALNNLK